MLGVVLQTLRRGRTFQNGQSPRTGYLGSRGSHQMRDLGAGRRVLARIPIPMSRTQMMSTAQVMIRILHLILALSPALAQKETEKKKSWAVKGTGYQIRNLDVAVRAGFGYGATHLRKLYSGCHFCQRCKLRRCLL